MRRQCRNHRTVDDIHGRFHWRYRAVRDRGDAISAARSDKIHAVAQQSLSGVQRNFLARPENLVAEAVGDMRFAFARQPDQPSRFHVEVCIMRGSHRIMPQSDFERFRAEHSARNH
jgi:hypothetical protein